MSVWKFQKSPGPGRDLGTPVLSPAAVAKVGEQVPWPGWPSRGRQAAPELAKVEWRTKRGVNGTAGGCRAHPKICEALDQVISYGNIDYSNVSVADASARWPLEDGAAIRRNPRSLTTQPRPFFSVGEGGLDNDEAKLKFSRVGTELRIRA